MTSKYLKCNSKEISKTSYMKKNFFYRTLFFLSAIALLFLIGCGPKISKTVSTTTNTATVDPWSQLPQILKQIKPPTFRNKDYLITSYGAVGDGKTMCTDAFKKAIADCNKDGGGRVVVPEGNFLTGAIHLKSNVN